MPGFHSSGATSSSWSSVRLSGGSAASMAVQMSVGLWKPRYLGRNRAAAGGLSGGLVAAAGGDALSRGEVGVSAARHSGVAVPLAAPASGAAVPVRPGALAVLISPVAGGGVVTGRLRRLGLAGGPEPLLSNRRRRVVPGPVWRRGGAGRHLVRVGIRRSAVRVGVWTAPAGPSARRGLVRGGEAASSVGRVRLPALGAAVSRLAGAWAARLGRALSGDGDPAGLRGRLVPVAAPPLSAASGRGREVALPPWAVVRLVGGRCGIRGLLV